MTRPLKILARVIAYGLFITFIVGFSNWPTYQHLAPDQATVKLSFQVAGELKQPCRQRSAEEIAEMAPNMRLLDDCPRERLPVDVVLKLDNQVLIDERLPPSGLKKDGVSVIYRHLSVPAGDHEVALRIRNSAHNQGHDIEKSIAITLKPAQVLVIELDNKDGTIVFQ